eukprot:maker-scaffold855_size87859-snap-gene-0.14 protein:Tk02430 transcript:maker-scaffold855_size87859-snap-gene-0.14-mRNA-1 annotation:"phosphatidylinositol 4-phosphate 3-kinase c2 domain-containing subunit beta"
MMNPSSMQHSGLEFPSARKDSSSAKARPRPLGRSKTNDIPRPWPASSRGRLDVEQPSSLVSPRRSSTPIDELASPFSSPKNLTWRSNERQSNNNNLIDLSGNSRELTNSFSHLYAKGFQNNNQMVPFNPRLTLDPFYSVPRKDCRPFLPPSSGSTSLSPMILPPVSPPSGPMSLQSQLSSPTGSQWDPLEHHGSIHQEYSSQPSLKPPGMVKSQSWNGGNPLQNPQAKSQNLSRTIYQRAFSQMKDSQSDFDLQEGASDSLIDFGPGNRNSQQRQEEEKHLTRVSVLDFFDPLTGRGQELQVDEGGELSVKNSDLPHHGDGSGNSSFYASALDNSVFDGPDHFEYLSEHSERSTMSRGKDPFDTFEYVDQGDSSSSNNADQITPNSSLYRTQLPNNTDSAVKRRQAQQAELDAKDGRKGFAFELIAGLHKERNVTMDREIVAFTKMVSAIRAKFKHDNKETNPGIVSSPKIKGIYPEGTIVKIIVYGPIHTQVTTFTSNVTSKVEMLIFQAALHLVSDDCDPEDYELQVVGSAELLDRAALLQDFQYVHQCYKFDNDIEFELTHRKTLVYPYLRTAQDDERDTDVKIEDISHKDRMNTLSYDDLHILLENLQTECERMKHILDRIVDGSEPLAHLIIQGINQSVKAVCTKLGLIETLDIADAIDRLTFHIIEFDPSITYGTLLRQSARVSASHSQYEPHPVLISGPETSHKQENIAKKAQKIVTCLDHLKDVTQKSVEVYAKTFRVNFSFRGTDQPTRSEPIDSTLDNLGLSVFALHRLPPSWILEFEDYGVRVDLYLGTTTISNPLFTPICFVTESFYEWVKFDTLLDFTTMPIANLPRETRVVFTLFGRKMMIKGEESRLFKTELGWASLQLFSFDYILAHGSYLLTIWSPEADKHVGPAPDSGSHPSADDCPVLSIDLPESTALLVFPDKIPLDMPSKHDIYNIEDLQFETKEHLMDICDLDIMTFGEISQSDQDLIWEKRHYLRSIPGALPKVLLAARAWDLSSLPNLHGLLHSWKALQAMDILQLFLPIFPDQQVRLCAIEWMANMDNDELIDYLPQLLEALKHETWSNSPLAELLLQRSLTSPRIAHTLYWNLRQALPGMTPQHSEGNRSSERVARYQRRLQMLLRALMLISGEAMRNSFVKQQELSRLLVEAAMSVEKNKDSRSKCLRRHMSTINQHLEKTETALPLSPSKIACGIDVERSGYFHSSTVPLKVIFRTWSQARIQKEVLDSALTSQVTETGSLPVIFKVGDDLRQDMITIQLIRVMEKMWLSEGLDLKIVTFSCVPTGDCQGMLELVSEAKTLREIHVMCKRGAVGSFNNRTIQEWLETNNPTPLEYTRAVDTFTKSCAGYCIATYLLGVCDRHNDNIMIKTSGHLFHIDFGKFMGDAEMFAGIKRDRNPFVLTPDMVYVINGGDKPTQKFQDFMDLCCKGFNILRKNGTMLLNLLALMSSSGIRGLISNDAVRYVQKALHPDLSPGEASQVFSRMIEESLKSYRFTQFNFYIHNIMQPASESNSGELLSFVPKRYSVVTDGAITEVKVLNVQKRYVPDRHYVFILDVRRQGTNFSSILFRSYKEFCELESMISSKYPDCRWRSRLASRASRAVVRVLISSLSSTSIVCE